MILGTELSKLCAEADKELLLVAPFIKAYIGTLLLQKPIIREVDSFVKTPQRFGAVKNLLNSLPCSEITGFNAERAWQTLMRWLLYFLPNRYALSVLNYSEVFSRIKTN